MKELVLDCGEYELVAEKDEGLYPALYIFFRDKATGAVADICSVRSADPELAQDFNCAECLVWSDPENEDYTHRFVLDIEKLKWQEEEP